MVGWDRTCDSEQDGVSTPLDGFLREKAVALPSLVLLSRPLLLCCCCCCAVFRQNTEGAGHTRHGTRGHSTAESRGSSSAAACLSLKSQHTEQLSRQLQQQQRTAAGHRTQQHRAPSTKHQLTYIPSSSVLLQHIILPQHSSSASAPYCKSLLKIEGRIKGYGARICY